MPAIDFKGRYMFSVAGIPFGTMDIAFTQDASQYNASSEIHTTGITRIFVQHDSTTAASGKGKNFLYTDVHYESDYQTRKKKKYVKIIRAHGVISEEVILPPDNRAVRPAVADALKNKSFDPLSYGLAIRSELTRALADKRTEFTLNYYDGRRLTEGTFVIVGQKIIKMGDKKTSTIFVTATRKTLAGFTQNELDDIKPNEAPLVMYFSDDDRHLPLRLEYPLIFGTASATLMGQ